MADVPHHPCAVEPDRGRSARQRREGARGMGTGGADAGGHGGAAEMFVTGYQTQDLVLKAAFTATPWPRSKSWRRTALMVPVIGIGGPYAGAKAL